MQGSGHSVSQDPGLAIAMQGIGSLFHHHLLLHTKGREVKKKEKKINILLRSTRAEQNRTEQAWKEERA